MKRCVFLDRDGTIIWDKGFLADPAGVEFLPNALAGLKQLQALGLPLVVVTNQSGIGRGLFTEAQMHRVHERLEALLAEHGIHLAAIYYCPHTPDDICPCRKPALGMLHRAEQELGCDLGASFVIGDRASDIELGKAAGSSTILLTIAPGDDPAAAEDASPDYVVHDLKEAASLVAEQVGGDG